MTWSNKALESVIATLESGSRPAGGVSTHGGDVLSIGGENILQSGGVTLEDVKRVPIAFFNKMTKGRLRGDDVLINKDGAQTGKVGWYRAGRDLIACINEHVFLLRGDPARITQGYLYYSLLSHVGQAQIRLQVSGSAQPGLKIGFTKGVNVEIPDDLCEQSMIVRVLSTVDRAIEETEALRAKQQRLKTGLMQDLLTRGIDEHGHVRSEQTQTFRNSPLGRVPASWTVTTLNQLTPADAPIGYGIVQPGAYDPSGVRVAGIYTINSGFQRWHMSSSAIEAAYQRSRIRSGDVLMSIKGSTGRVGVVPPNVQGNISREIARIRPGPMVNPHFLRFQLLSSSYQRYLLNAEVGTTRAELSIKVLRELSVAVPPPGEQDEIALRLEGAERNLGATRSSLKKLRRVKVGLMQDLLTGNRRVTPLLEPREGVAT
ncbi:MAG: restriction endonuclease subunit S [Acidobacteria bacterium]|nr:restriction endonuclease subunit S [Acidobacteriota bacterium]